METDAPGSEQKKPTTTQDVDATKEPTIKKELVSTVSIVSTILHSRFLFAFLSSRMFENYNESIIYNFINLCS